VGWVVTECGSDGTREIECRGQRWVRVGFGWEMPDNGVIEDGMIPYWRVCKGGEVGWVCLAGRRASKMPGAIGVFDMVFMRVNDG
jgi:hypothetical protein